MQGSPDRQGQGSAAPSDAAPDQHQQASADEPVPATEPVRQSQPVRQRQQVAAMEAERQGQQPDHIPADTGLPASAACSNPDLRQAALHKLRDVHCQMHGQKRDERVSRHHVPHERGPSGSWSHQSHSADTET